MRKRQFVLTAVLATVLFSAVAQEKVEKKEKPKEMTITGEVIDVKCYLTGMMGGKGEEHKQCAIDCIQGGLPVGILEDKTDSVYTVVPKGGMKGGGEELLPHVAQKVKLTGTVIRKGGERMFVYTKVEGVK